MERLRNSYLQPFLDHPIFFSQISQLIWIFPQVCAIGSKGGSVLIWNHTNDSFGKCYLDTDHPGGSIQNMKVKKTYITWVVLKLWGEFDFFFQFDFWNRRKVYTCSIDGTFLSREFREGSGAQDHEVKKFLETGSYERWFTSFDVSFVGKCLHTKFSNLEINVKLCYKLRFKVLAMMMPWSWIGQYRTWVFWKFSLWLLLSLVFSSSLLSSILQVYCNNSISNRS